MTVIQRKEKHVEDQGVLGETVTDGMTVHLVHAAEVDSMVSLLMQFINH